MGQCLSCCDNNLDQNNARTAQSHNGHPAKVAKTGGSSHSSSAASSNTKYQSHQQQQLSGGILTTTTTSLSTNVPSSHHQQPVKTSSYGHIRAKSLTGDDHRLNSGLAVRTGAATQSSNIVDPAINTKTASDSKKMFAPYAKLPPIRSSKSGSGGLSGGSSGGENKRSSFPRGGNTDYCETKIHHLFDHYRDPSEEDAMTAEGIEAFCRDLEVKPEEFKVLALAWKFDASQMCYFSRSEFVDGCKKLRVDSVRGIRAKFPELVAELQGGDHATYKMFYRWTYKFGLEAGQRTLPTDVAAVLWKLVFTAQEPPILDQWLSFLVAHPSIRGIPRDTWDMFLNLTEAVGDDLSAYDDAEAWPSLFDDFVEYENDRQNQNVSEKEIKSTLNHDF